MPTGYTAGIIDGTTKDFKAYAKDCMRNFGACIHMRDSKFSDEWKPDTVSDYHPKEIVRLEKEQRELAAMTDADLLALRKKQLNRDIRYHKKGIQKQAETESILNKFLVQSKAFEAPTAEHTGIRDFMIKQIEDTIDFDCRSTYHADNVLKAQDELKSLDVVKIRSDKQEAIQKDLAYHKEHLEQDKKRVAGRNKWVTDFLASL